MAKFATAFTATGTQESWIAGLRPYTTRDLLAGFRYTAPTRRPTGTVVSVTPEPHSAAFTITYSTGAQVRCTLGHRPGAGWRVTGVEPVKERATSGASA